MIAASPRPRRWLPLLATTLALGALIYLLHAPVFTRGALVTPAGMHYGQWPWKPFGAAAKQEGALLQTNSTLSDLLFQIYPWQLYAARSFAAGRLPLWNPYSYCGAPFLANMQSAVLYPLHWPAWLMSPERAMHALTFALLAKTLLAGLFMTIFLRGLGLGAHACVAGSVTFALCGFMTSWLGYAHTNAAIFLPLLMHGARLIAAGSGPAGFLIFALAGAAQYLGGHPETSLHMMAVATVCFLWNARGADRFARRAGLFAAAGLMGFAMAAVQLLPFIEYLLQSAQLANRQAATSLDPSLGASALLAFLVPGIFGTPLDGTWAYPVPWQAVAGYTGAGAVLLALVSLRRGGEARLYQLLLAGALLVVYMPAWAQPVLRLIPVVGVTANNRLLLVVSFCIATLAAMEIGALGRRREAQIGAPGARMADLVWLSAAAGALLLAASPALDRDPAGVRTAFVVIAGTAVLAGLVVLRPRMAPLHLTALVAVSCLDMLLFATGFNPHADAGALFPATPLVDFVQKDRAADPARGGRLMTIGWTMRPETHLVYALPSIEGYDAMEFADYRHTLDAAQVGEIHTSGAIPDSSRAALDGLGLRYLVAPPGATVSAPGFTPAYDGIDGRVLINDAARRRFAAGDGAISVVRDDAGWIELSLPPAPQARRVEISETWDRGWRARVNGAPAPVLRLERSLIAVEMPPQGGSLTLRYRPASFVAGAIISVLSLIVTAAAGLRVRALL